MHAHNIMAQKYLPNYKPKKNATALCVRANLPNSCVCSHTSFCLKKSFVESSTPKLRGRSEIIITNNAQYHQEVCENNKINVTLIFGVSRINAKF